MSERKSYEDIDRQFSDLPMPDEEVSWQKMKERLDKEDDGGTVVPPVLLRTCMGWGIVLLAGLIVAWLVVRPDRWSKETTRSERNSNSKSKSEQTNLESASLPANVTLEEVNKPVNSKLVKDEELKSDNTPVQGYEARGANNHIASKAVIQKNRGLGFKDSPVVIRRSFSPLITNKADNNKPNNIQNKEVVKQGEAPRGTDTSLVVKKQAESPPADSTQKDNTPQQVNQSPQKKSGATQKKLIAAAGLGLQQLIPIAGQTLVPYTYYGRDASIADYIPSVYLQLHKKGKWFIMGEFRFGGAQSVKEFSYNRKTRYDTATMNTTVTTMRLKKTYYHQLPFTFNYYLLHNLSVGVGGMYSRFYGAVTEKETDTWNTLTQKYTNVKQIIPMKHFNDSFLYKTQVHVLLQADYQWKRFSFGLRYTKDVQPYIKFTNPDGTVDEKRNQALQLMVRYRIWQSAKL